MSGAVRKRLLVVASTYPRHAGDTEPGFVHELARRLVDSFDVTVLCPHAPGAATREILDGVDVRRYRYGPAALETLINDGGMLTNLRRDRWKWLMVPPFAFAQFLTTAWTIVRLRPQVIHAHWLLPQGLIVAVAGLVGRRSPRFIVTSHGADLFALRGGLMRRVKRFVVRHAARVTVVSAAMLPPLAELGADPARVSVQPMGVDLTTRFRPPTQAMEPEPRLLFVGRLVEKKGLTHLISAMPRIRAAVPGAALDIVGFGPQEMALRQQVAASGLDDCVTFLGAQPQERLPDLYRSAAVFVAPFVEAADGDQEGLGLVLVEAAACGCPIVAGDVPAVRDVLTSPEVGAIVPARDSGRLADAVIAALRAGRSPATDAARARAVDAFDWRVRADAYAALLHTVADE